MKCPKCKNDMNIESKETSFNIGNKEYDKTVYLCSDDDIWIVVEIPKKEIN